MKKSLIFVFVCMFFFSIFAGEKYNIVIEDGVCSVDDEFVEIEISDAEGHKTLKRVKCPEVQEEVPEIPTVVRLVEEKVEKNYFFGNLSYRLSSEKGLTLQVPSFSGGFMSRPFIKGKAGVKISLGYGLPSNSDGFRHMLEWKLLMYVKTYKDFLNLNVGYLGSCSWGNDSFSRNESAGMLELEYFIVKNFSLSIGGYLGGSRDIIYNSNGNWKFSGGLIVSTSVRF